MNNALDTGQFMLALHVVVFEYRHLLENCTNIYTLMLAFISDKIYILSYIFAIKLRLKEKKNKDVYVGVNVIETVLDKLRPPLQHV